MTLEYLQEYVLKNPRSALFARLADEYLKAQNTDRALNVCLNGLQYYPDYSTAHVVVARCLARKGDIAGALSHIEQALRRYPGNAVLVELRNQWTELLGGAARPGSQWRPVVEQKNPAPAEVEGEYSVDDMPFVSATLAEIYAAQGAYEAAITMYRKLQQQKPNQSAQFEKKIGELKEKIRRRG